MATLEYGPLITKARGSIRGTTFSRVIGGETARGRPYPRRPHTANQALIRQYLTLAAAKWTTETIVIQGLWNVYASSVTLTNRIGQTFHPTGQMMYIRRYVFALLADIGPNTDVLPSESGLPITPTYAWSFHTDALWIDNQIIPNPAIFWLLWTITKPSTSPQASKRWLHTRIATVGGPGWPSLVIAGFVTNFPAARTIFFDVHSTVHDESYRIGNVLTEHFALVKA